MMCTVATAGRVKFILVRRMRAPQAAEIAGPWARRRTSHPVVQAGTGRPDQRPAAQVRIKVPARFENDARSRPTIKGTSGSPIVELLAVQRPPRLELLCTDDRDLDG